MMRKLGRHFSLLVGALLIGTIVVCSAGLFGLTRLDTALDATVSVDLPRLMTITDLRKRIRQLVVAEGDYLLETNPEKARTIVKDLAKGIGEVHGLFARYQPYLLRGDIAEWNALQANFREWTDINAKVLALARAGKTAEATKLSRSHSKKWEALIKTLIANADAHLQQATAGTHQVAKTSRGTLMGVFGASVLLGGIAGLFIYRAIRHTVDEVVSLKDRLLDVNQGLERTVEERTRAIRAILDHVQFGFFLVGRDLRITEGHTRSLSALLRKDKLAGERASEMLGFSGDRAFDFDFRVEQIFDDFLPAELSCDQVPARAVFGDRVLRIQASAVRGADGQVAQVLFGVSDVTDLEAAERANRNNQTVLRALRDPEPFRRFVSDLNQRFGSVREAVETDDERRARRELHTIKGNASCYGLTELASGAHKVEESQRIELSPIIDLEREFEGFLESNLDLLGLKRNATEREVYRLDSAELSALEEMIKRTRDVDSLRPTLLRRLDRLRWQPAGRLVGPLDTQVVGLGERLGKDVVLRVVGGDTQVVPASVMPVISVLPHLLRNAIDHGVEAPGARGDKPRRATIELGFSDAGDAWHLTVRDDGRGINVEALRARAVALGLIKASDTLTHDQLCQLIFAPKLSTAEEVSDVSGRGEGLAAVADAVKQAGGRITVLSQSGAGTTFLIAIPKPPPPRMPTGTTLPVHVTHAMS